MKRIKQSFNGNFFSPLNQIINTLLFRTRKDVNPRHFTEKKKRSRTDSAIMAVRIYLFIIWLYDWTCSNVAKYIHVKITLYTKYNGTKNYTLNGNFIFQPLWNCTFLSFSHIQRDFSLFPRKFYSLPARGTVIVPSSKITLLTRFIFLKFPSLIRQT